MVPAHPPMQPPGKLAVRGVAAAALPLLRARQPVIMCVGHQQNFRVQAHGGEPGGRAQATGFTTVLVLVLVLVLCCVDLVAVDALPCCIHLQTAQGVNLTVLCWALPTTTPAHNGIVKVVNDGSVALYNRIIICV